MKCSDCAFCFPNYDDDSNIELICAGGSSSGEFYKDYGDAITSKDINVEHSCFGFKLSLEAFINLQKKRKDFGRV